MPTNLDIDEKLLETAMRLGGHRSKREAVNAALAEYIQWRKRLAVLECLGTISFDPGFDYKKARMKR
jgi:Arc/MetJ family transcription regulator